MNFHIVCSLLRNFIVLGDDWMGLSYLDIGFHSASLKIDCL